MVKSEFPDNKVAAVLVVCNGRVLCVFNEKWGAYTLPMSKCREWKDPTGAAVTEDWLDAAIRARTEWVPGTRRDAPVFEFQIPEYQQSDRDGQWKRYGFHVFKVVLDDPQAPKAGGVTEWLTADEIMDESRRPISKTARDIVRQAGAEAELNGRAFP